MRTVTRYQSYLPVRRSYKPARSIRVGPALKLTLVFRPDRPASVRVSAPGG